MLLFWEGGSKKKGCKTSWWQQLLLPVVKYLRQIIVYLPLGQSFHQCFRSYRYSVSSRKTYLLIFSLPYELLVTRTNQIFYLSGKLEQFRIKSTWAFSNIVWHHEMYAFSSRHAFLRFLQSKLFSIKPLNILTRKFLCFFSSYLSTSVVTSQEHL